MASAVTEGKSTTCDTGSSNRPLFMDVSADEELETTEVDSLCMQCGETVRDQGHLQFIFMHHV